jgi:ABC-type transporter Mla maintaining outer membrane lipid asymmetry permease subunit MlaE
MRRIVNAIKFCVALPLYQIREVARYAQVQPTLSEKVGVVISMLPIFIFTTLCWGMLWAFALAGLRKLVNL